MALLWSPISGAAAAGGDIQGPIGSGPGLVTGLVQLPGATNINGYIPGKSSQLHIQVIQLRWVEVYQNGPGLDDQDDQLPPRWDPLDDFGG